MSDTRRMIEDSTQRLFSEQVDRDVIEAFEAGAFPEALWRQVSDGGFPLAAVPESAGGIGASWAECYPIVRGVGYWRVPLPLADTMVATHLLARAGIEVPDGPLVLVEQDGLAPLEIDGANGGATVSGEARGVGWARACAHAVISARIDGEPSVLLVELGDAVELRGCRENTAREPRDDLLFTATPAIARGALPADVPARPAKLLGAMTRAAMLVGAMESVLDESVRYANDRVQFGRPIAKYQAIQQSLAVLAGEVGAARTATRVAFDDAIGPTTPFDVAIAKVRAGDAATRAAAIAHQVHGAIGFTREHTLHFATRRLWSWRADWGTEAQWAQAIGQAAIAAGSAGFWPRITDRALL